MIGVINGVVIIVKVDYKEVCKFYWSIIVKIYDYCRDEGKYLDAYGYLQKAEWRLDEVEDMWKYYDEPNFKYFALDNFCNVRNRIESYIGSVEDTLPEEVYEFKKYDYIYEGFKIGSENLKFVRKYRRIMYKESKISALKSCCSKLDANMKNLKYCLEMCFDDDIFKEDDLKSMITNVEEFMDCIKLIETEISPMVKGKFE